MAREMLKDTRARLLRILAVFTSIFAFGAPVRPADLLSGEPSQLTIDQRVQRVREIIVPDASAGASGSPEDQQEGPPDSTQQWPNWPNWNNFRNWNNWPNWGNWGNWRNF